MISPTGRRTGKGGRGIRPEVPEALGSVLRRLLGDLRIEERSREGALASAWEKAAGRELAGKARPVAFRAGLLTVEGEGAPLMP